MTQYEVLLELKNFWDSIGNMAMRNAVQNDIDNLTLAEAGKIKG